MTLRHGEQKKHLRRLERQKSGRLKQSRRKTLRQLLRLLLADIGREKIGESSTTSASSSFEGPPPKKIQLNKPTSNSSDDNVCCMCFGTYQNDNILQGADAEWISCACGRWLHEDCCEECMTDEDGQDRLCPFYVDILSV